jgi:hypothetical protein
MFVVAAYLIAPALLPSTVVLADPPPGGTPPPVKCGSRPARRSGDVADGYYVGREPIKAFRGVGPGEKWFHEVVVTISGGKASTDEMPVVYVRGERHESVSDGGFYYFEGCLTANGDHYSADMRLMKCDYCESKVAPTKTLSIKPLGTDIAIDGKPYRRVAKPKRW